MKCKYCIHFPKSNPSDNPCDKGLDKQNRKLLGVHASISCPYFKEIFVVTCLTCNFFLNHKADLENGVLGHCCYCGQNFLDIYNINACENYRIKQDLEKGEGMQKI